MKKLKTGLIYSLILGAVISYTSCKEQPQKNSFSTIERNFRRIPDDTKLAVYWYWMSDNISKEGVIKDLEAMKAQGINRAYIGNIAQPKEQIPYGKVKIFTEEWWEVIHTALKTATDLNIEIGIFNSPGWSQSGGPWVKPEQAMRYLASSQMEVKGPQKLITPLPELENAQDVKVLAFPSIASKEEASFRMQTDEKGIIELIGDKEATIRSIIVQTKPQPVNISATFLLAEGNGIYHAIRDFNIDRSNAELNVGFDPYAPIVISVPAVKGKQFRLAVTNEQALAIESVILSSLPRVERYPEKTLAKMFQTPLPLWADYLWKEQPAVDDSSLLIKPNQIIDLTNKIENGTLSWDVPEGDWTIMRTAMKPTGVTNAPATPEGTGLEVDKMSKEHVAAHFDAFLGEILRRIPEQDRKSFKIVVEDSYETGGQNWTDTMIDDFTQRYGYSPIPYLPVLQGYVIGSQDLSDRFLWDLRRLIADKVSYDYVGGLKEISNKHGLTTWLENYGHWGFPGEFLQYGGQSDEISGEFWSVGSLGDIENKAASSCGHIYGKNKVWAESFTCGGPEYYRYPAEMKQRGDRFFTEGINSTLLHLFIEQPDEQKPGINAPFGNEFNRHNTWFSQMDVFAKYIKRCNYMLQQGLYVADVAYFIGEDAPKMTGLCEPALPKGYSFDYINAEILETQAKVDKDGMLSLKSGMRYRVLVLPPLKTMRPEVLAKIKELVNSGLVILGNAPTQSPSLSNYPEADKQVQSLAKELWGKVDGEQIKSTTFGRGRVYCNISLEEIFKDMNLVPDFGLSQDTPLLFIHRTTPEGEIYFISNQSENIVKATPAFRVQEKQPEWWNPQTAEIRPLQEYTQKDMITEVPIELQAFESTFIIFRLEGNEYTKEKNKLNFPEKKEICQLNGPWTVSFQKDRKGPEQPVIFDQLQDWKMNENEQIKYFSGEATYTTTFNLNQRPKGNLYLDLGKVMVMAKVTLNGKYIGGVWTMPYRLNVTEFLKKGENKLEVTVVNNWMNRLIGEARYPYEERTFRVNYNTWNANSQLQTSGLLGPVNILSFE